MKKGFLGGVKFTYRVEWVLGIVCVELNDRVRDFLRPSVSTLNIKH